MFDNPKKELERLEQELLAVESSEKEPDFDAFSDEEYGDLPEAGDFFRRSAGFDIPTDTYIMDSSRYVPAPRKKRRGGLLLIVCVIAALIAWRMGWLS